MQTVIQILGIVVGTILGLGIVFMVSMRTKFEPVMDVVKRINRSFWNPRSMETAGTPGAYASIIEHVGRKSGSPYRTPIGVIPADDGFLVALPYGTTPDWLKNVMAAGSATLVTEGSTYGVDRPEIVNGEVANPYFPPKEQRNHRMFAIDEFLLLHRAGEPEA